MKKLILLAVVFLACSCTASMKMPDGCKPPKKEKHSMVKPDYPQNPKKLKYGKK